MEVAAGLLPAQVSRYKVRQGKLLKQAAQLKSQASKLNHPDTFASSAKLQRQAASHEKEAELISKQQVACMHDQPMLFLLPEHTASLHPWQLVFATGGPNGSQ